MRTLTALLALLAVVAPFAPVAAQAPVDNAAMEQAISATLVEKLGDDASTIRVAYYDGKVVLSGQVVEDATRELAKEVALYVLGVNKAENEVEAKNERHVGAGKMLAEIKDAGLESDVKAKLRAEMGRYAEMIEVEACNGVVTLRGNVPDKPRHDYAMAAAQQVKGVEHAIDLIRFGS